jgi:hypothetical protein
MGDPLVPVGNATRYKKPPFSPGWCYQPLEKGQPPSLGSCYEPWQKGGFSLGS